LGFARPSGSFVPSTLKRLAKGKIGVGTLMTIAAVGAVILGEIGEAAMLAFLFSISEGLEEYSLARTRRGLRALLSLVPDEATILRDGTEIVVAPTELRVGDRMLVKPGERIATDGIIRQGRTALDVSAITGESVPVEAGAADEVFAGSINGTGSLEVEVTTTAEDNSLARIVRIVEAEQSRKGASQRLADRIAKPLVPAIMIAGTVIAVTGSIFGDPATWIERALVVLVAASPCALAISVPVTVVAAIGAASKLARWSRAVPRWRRSARYAASRSFAQGYSDPEPPRQPGRREFDGDRHAQPRSEPRSVTVRHITGDEALAIAAQLKRGQLALESPHKRYRRP
jgi:cation-transporting ATPase G